MKKGEISRDKIVEASVEVFNTKGYAGTSMQDLMDRTGFKKGGIYRHFESKEELAAAAFEKAYGKLKAAYTSVWEEDDRADLKLRKFFLSFKKFLIKPPVRGGCPILNTATEADDTNPTLSKLARKAAQDWEQTLTSILEEGKAAGSFKADIHVPTEAKFIISSIEGGILFTKLHRDLSYGLAVGEMLLQRLEQIRKE